MKILVLAERLPSPLGGGSARQYHLIRELSRRHEISVLAYAYPPDMAFRDGLSPYVKSLEIIEVPLPTPQQHPKLYWQLNGWRHALLDTRPNRGRSFDTTRFRRLVRQTLAEHSFDLVQVHQAYMMPIVPHTKAPILLDLHDILSEHERRAITGARKATHHLAAWLEWRKMQALEREAIRRVRICVSVSETDQATLLAAFPGTRTVVVPNGVDTEYFQPLSLVAEEMTLVFVGSMNYQPNVDAVLWFAGTILPVVKRQQPRADFCIVGWDPPAEVQVLAADPAITVTGFVPDVRPYLGASVVVVVPIRQGSGTRLKILDAWAMGKAVISTTLGAEGLLAVHDGNILLADEPESIAEAVVALLGDAPRRARLGQAGRLLVEHEYSWPSIAKRMEAAYEQCVQGHDQRRQTGWAG